MTPETFRHWLAERGCTFEEDPRTKGGGIPSVTVRREGRRARLPDGTSKQDLDPRDVRAVVESLDLDWRELPGPSSRV